MSGKYVIDTSSLVNLAKYVLPLDTHGLLRQRVKRMLTAGEIILLNEVAVESSKFIKHGELPDLHDLISGPVKIIEFEPARTPDLNRKLNKDWCFLNRKKKALRISSRQNWSEVISEYCQSADYALIVYAMSNGATIVTEESRKKNDGKYFKKIPIICDQENIPVMDIMGLLKHWGVEGNFSIAPM